MTFWPVSKTGYPAEGSPNSFKQICQDLAEVGCDITLAGRSTTKRQRRRPKLALRGPFQVLQGAYRILVTKTLAAGIRLDMKHLPVVQWEDDEEGQVEDPERDSLIKAADKQEQEREEQGPEEQEPEEQEPEGAVVVSDDELGEEEEEEPEEQEQEEQDPEKVLEVVVGLDEDGDPYLEEMPDWGAMSLMLPASGDPWALPWAGGGLSR